MFRLLANSIELDPDDSPDWARMRFSDLADEQKKQIYNYTFIVRTLPEMEQEQLRAMFQRLNRNVELAHLRRYNSLKNYPHLWH